MTKKAKTPDYDGAWKIVIEGHLEAFLEFFFPEIHKDIDFSRKYEILSKDLQRIVIPGTARKRHADVLLKVYLKDGTEKCICILMHVEIQGDREPHFMKRVFVYFYRIFDKFMDKGIEIISLAILTDDDKNYRPNVYSSGRWGFKIKMEIPLVKTVDYKNKKEFREKLESSKNPMALAVKVQLKSREYKNRNNNQGLNLKVELMREYYRKGYDRKFIHSLFRFLDSIFQLPETMERMFSEEIFKMEEEHNMPYITSIERIAKKDGKKEGEKERTISIARELIKIGIAVTDISKATGLSIEEIQTLSETVH
ncbi:MAG: transposase [bacterium]|nr:transposase [bacterium]